MSFGIDTRKLKKLVELYRPTNHAEEMKYILHLRGEEELFINLETCPFQGISNNSIEDRRATFGPNHLQSLAPTLSTIVLHPLSISHIQIPLLLAFALLLLAIASPQAQGNPILEAIIALGVAVGNWGLRCMQGVWQWWHWGDGVQLDQEGCRVIRENRKQEIGSGQLVVGDIVEIRAGDRISADGWLIEASNLVLDEKYTSEFVEVRKDTLKSCVQLLKPFIQEGKDFVSTCSPVLLSGSLVRSGEGRMVVLAVGKLSRRGEFAALTRHQREPNHLQLKLEDLISTVMNWFLALSAFYLFVLIARILYQSFTSGDWQNLTQNWEGKGIRFGIWGVLAGGPQSLAIGVLVGLWVMKVQLWVKQTIWVERCADCPRMAAVTEICYDKQKDWGRTHYKEWWNEETTQFKREQTPKLQQSLQTEENYIDNEDTNERFKDFMTRSMKLRQSKQPGHQYILTPEVILKKNPTNDWTVFSQMQQGCPITYVCESSTIRYAISYESVGKKECASFIKGEGEDLIDHCSHIMLKSTGQTKELSNSLRTQIKDIIRSMNRRLATTFAVGFTLASTNSTEQLMDRLVERKLVFLCLLGVSGTRDHSEYEIVRKLKESGINLILVSNQGFEEAVNRSKYIGISTVQEDSLALQGADFMRIVGEVICQICKRSICSCEDSKSYQPRLKNLQEFRRITKYLRVVSNATYQHKYALLVGFSNIGCRTACLGGDSEDQPALAHAHLALGLAPTPCSNAAVIFPNNSLKSLFSFISWSRQSSDFLRKYVQLALPAAIVPAILMLVGGSCFGGSPITLLQALWVQIGLGCLLSLCLSWQKPTENSMNIRQETYGESSRLITEPICKQIVAQCVYQTFLLLAVLLVGHLYIPESPDSIDEILGSNWSAKYSSADLSTVANGLQLNPLLGTPSYSGYDTFGISSRHLTVVFNIYSLMQIFNCLNCRRIRDKQINVLEDIEPQSGLLLAATLLAHYFFMILAPTAAQLYPHSLTLQQWLVSAGLAMSVWLVGFLVRLLPSQARGVGERKVWGNKSYNLGVKLIVKKNKLSEFDTEDDLQFKDQ